MHDPSFVLELVIIGGHLDAINDLAPVSAVCKRSRAALEGKLYLQRWRQKMRRTHELFRQAGQETVLREGYMILRPHYSYKMMGLIPFRGGEITKRCLEWWRNVIFYPDLLKTMIVYPLAYDIDPDAAPKAYRRIKDVPKDTLSTVVFPSFNNDGGMVTLL